MQLLQTELSDSKQQVDQLQSQTKKLETSLQTIQVGYAFKNLLYTDISNLTWSSLSMFKINVCSWRKWILHSTWNLYYIDSFQCEFTNIVYYYACS